MRSPGREGNTPRPGSWRALGLCAARTWEFRDQSRGAARSPFLEGPTVFPPQEKMTRTGEKSRCVAWMGVKFASHRRGPNFW